MINLKEIYDNIQNLLTSLYEFDLYSPYQKTVNDLDTEIDKLCHYFGIRHLKKDIGPLKANEIVLLEQDDGGVWLSDLDGKRMINMYEYILDSKDLFYEQ